MRSALFFLTGSAVGAVILVPLFLLIHGVPSVSASWWLVLAAFVAGIPVHELIHGVTCAYVSDNNYKSISYGVSLTRFLRLLPLHTSSGCVDALSGVVDAILCPCCDSCHSRACRRIGSGASVCNPQFRRVFQRYSQIIHTLPLKP